jgi:hypothetical protein
MPSVFAGLSTPMRLLRTTFAGIFLLGLPLQLSAEMRTVPTKKVAVPSREHSTFLFSPTSNDRSWIFGVGMRLTIIPKRVAESETRFFPIVEAYLNKNFLRFGQWRNAVGVLYLQNYVSSGLFAVYRRRGISIAIGNSIALWGGVFNSSGFDALSATLVTHPTLTIGKNLSHYYYWLPDSFSISYKLNILHNRYVRLGNTIYQERLYSFEGFAVVIMAEYYTGEGGIYFGLQINRARPGYEFWLAFSDYNQFFNYTTLFAGYRF